MTIKNNLNKNRVYEKLSSTAHPNLQSVLKGEHIAERGQKYVEIIGLLLIHALPKSHFLRL